MRGVYAERERLEGLAKRLHSLSAGNSQELARMKEQQQQLKQELEESVAQHGESGAGHNTASLLWGGHTPWMSEQRQLGCLCLGVHPNQTLAGCMSHSLSLVYIHTHEYMHFRHLDM